MTQNMTEGSPLKLMIRFALPLLGGNLLQQMYNLVDAAIVGQILGADALASVGASTSVQFLVLGFCMGTCAGFGVPIAKYFGANQKETMRRYIFNAGLLTAGMAVLVTTLCALLCPRILHLLSTPEDIFDGAYSYLLIIFLGIPATLLYNILSSILRSVGDSKTPFFFLAFSACLNIFLDLFCIVVLHWGVAGAAIATVASQAISGMLCFLHIRKRMEILHLHRQDREPRREIMGELLVMGLPMGLQFSITAIGSMVMQSANNGLGSIYVSGFTAGMRLKQFFMCPFDAMATSVSVFCSQNLGARKPDRMRSGLYKGMIMGTIYGLIAGVILILGGRTMSLLFVSADSTAVLDASAKYVGSLGLFYWALGPLNVCRMATQGIGYAGRAVISGVMEMVARSVVSLTLVPVFGYTAVCFTDQTAWIAACLYIVPTCLYCMNKVTKEMDENG